ncbi:MAG: hypothetical protein GY944_07150 [bacterium]|nr:hypothetical protein [bacterium]
MGAGKGGTTDNNASDKQKSESKECGEDRQVIRITRSVDALRNRLDAIESGKEPKPDWIHLQAACRLDKLRNEELTATVKRLHRCVLRGFKANNVEIKKRKDRRKYWTTIAQNGFHDFSDLGWMKCYDSPFVENYDYVTPYLEGGIEALDPYLVYSSVLGTHDYGVEDFVTTKLCQGVDTIIEPMSGTAELCYQGHFRYPHFRYLMLDLDEDARAHVEAKPWLEGTERQYVIADVLDEEIWKRVKSFTATKSLSYLGKQSHHLFNAKQLYRLLEVATNYVDYFMLETPQVSLPSDMDEIDELTRPEMEDAGFEVDLIDEDDGAPNPFTNLMAFSLVASNARRERTLFEYQDWTVWSQPTLVAMARLLDLNVVYFHADHEEFLSVEDAEEVEECDCLENVTFMLFTRHPID